VLEKLLGVWPIWNFALARKSKWVFLVTMGVVLFSIGTPLYHLTNHLMTSRGITVFDPVTSIDLAIPFLAWTLLIYHSLFYFFYPLPLVSMPDTKRGRYEVLILGQSLLVTTLLSNVWFVICPAEVHLRDAVELSQMHPFFAPMYERLWSVDSPYNSWPSLHVSVAGLFALFAIRWWKGRPALQWLAGVFWILTCLSILTTKQHFLLDLVTGWLLLGAIWKWQVVPGLKRVDAKLVNGSPS